MIRTLQHVSLGMPKPDDAKRFYSTFGLHVKEAQGGVVARCAGRDQDQVVIREAAKPGLDYLSFGTNAADLPVAKQRLEAHGTKLLDPPLGGPEGLWFRDVDGNFIHLGLGQWTQPRPVAPLPYNSSTARARLGVRGCPGFDTEPRPVRLMHVILFTPDPPRMARFYTEVLGMKLSDQVGEFVMFMRGASDGDHHLVGLLRDPNPGLHHMSFEMESLDHMELRALRVKAAGYKHVWGAGRHTVGSNLFHYFRDPWGTLAEYSFDIDFIPEGAAWEARDWSKEQGLFLWSVDGPPPPDFPRNLLGAK